MKSYLLGFFSFLLSSLVNLICFAAAIINEFVIQPLFDPVTKGTARKSFGETSKVEFQAKAWFYNWKNLHQVY
jgi:hypothetical protein